MKKSKKEKSREKKHKKKEKQKKKKMVSSSSASESDGSLEWQEKSPAREESPERLEGKAVDDTPKRDEWMTAPTLFACVTRDQLRAEKLPSQKKKEEEAAKYMLDRPGQSERELNPYWANSGTGLPSEKPVERESLTLASTTVGDQGANWLRRALQRAKEQAAETGRTLEEVAAERWGSLQKLEEMLAEAEGRKYDIAENKRRSATDMYEKRGRGGFRHEERWRADKEGQKHRRDCYENDNRRWKSKYDERNEDQRRRGDDRRDEQRHREKPTFIRPGNDEESYEKSKNSGRSSEREESSYSRYKSNRADDSSYESYKNSKQTRFLKPGNDDGDTARSTETRYSSSTSRSWRKKEFEPKKETRDSLEDRKKPIKEEEKLNIPVKEEEKQVSDQSDSDSDIVEEPKIEVLTDQQMNELAAKLVKAEILGNDELVAELKSKLENARKTRGANPTALASAEAAAKSKKEQTVILSVTDSRGFSRPLQPKGAHPEPTGGRRRKQKVETHSEDGKRARYFPDDDKYSLQDMFQKEKFTSAQDQNEMFTNLAGKDGRQEHDFDMDDIFAEKARVSASDGKLEEKERLRAIAEHKRKERSLDNCRWCFDSKQLLRHLVVAIGSKSYVCLPPYESLTTGHCLVVPLHHTVCSTQLDEDVWEEMQNFRKALVKMFASEDEDCVWFESAMYLNKFPHMTLHCVPMPRESGDMAPVYFKKALLECESEWNTNKKVVDLSKKNIRHSVPKGLPYFAVDFGLQGGFAHVIEDEKTFPSNFAQEIIGGMLELDHSVWRKPRNENFDKQRRKVMEFAKKWEPFDFTKRK